MNAPPSAAPPPSRSEPSAPPPRPLESMVLPAAVAAALAVPVAMLIGARGGISFPLDDAWIHLQYARNLGEHGAFTYFPGDHSTAGSTAPLFTLIETVLLKILRNEIVTGVALGLVAHAGFLLALAAWARRRTGSAAWAAFAVAMVALDGRFGLLAVSGMETSLFLLGLALAFLAWTRRNALLAGAAIGAAAWVRPEALVLAGVFAIEALLERRRPARLGAGLVALLALAGGYAGFNFLTGGAAFPNTLVAKSAFYAGTPFMAFLRGDVAATFGGGWWVVAPLALLVTLAQLPRLLRRDDSDSTVRAEFGWAVALVLAYAVVLPFSHRFNRYLLPALPAVAVAGATALRRLSAWFASRSFSRGGVGLVLEWLTPLVAIGALVAQAAYFAPTFEDFRFFARYHLDRHVRAGRWLAENTPPGAVVATHDVGAIAYYSRRRIVDMAGLVTPEVVPHLGKRDLLPFLEDLCDRRGVTQLAVLEEWQPVDNVRPRFLADPKPERLYVYDWIPGRTHLLDPGLATEIDSAAAAMRRGDFRAAWIRTGRGLNADTSSARLWLLAGSLAFRNSSFEDAALSYAHALRLNPDAPEARAGVGVSMARLGRMSEARVQLDSLRANPDASVWAETLEKAIEAGPAKAPASPAPRPSRLRVERPVVPGR